MIDIGFAGWMADFGGEYLPVTNEMQFHDKSQNSENMHNVYSYLWAKMNREVYEEDGTGNIFIFMRSGALHNIGVQFYAESDRHRQTRTDERNRLDNTYIPILLYISN